MVFKPLEAVFHTCDLQEARSKKLLFIVLHSFFKMLVLPLVILLLIAEPPLVVAHISFSAFHYGTPYIVKNS